ncbi:MAG: HlyC/CorC family transporter [Pseudomonadota bacterium]
MEDIPIGLLLAALLILLVASGFFSAAETSMMTLNRYRLKHLVKSGNRGARLTAQLLEKTDKLLGVVLLGNNLLNAASAALVTIITIRLFGGSELMLTVGTLAVTFLILVFSEITPKVLGATYPERIAFPAGYVLAPLLKVFYPVIWFVNLFVSALLRLLRLKPSPGNMATTLSIEELRTLVLEAGHYIPQKHQNILLNLLGLGTITVEDVMTPRSQIEAVDIEMPIEDIRGQLSTSHHTRVPIFQDQLDNIIGILHVRRVLSRAQSGELNVEDLHQAMRVPYFTPAGTPLLTQLQYFQENHERIGLVVDEYGELQGLISLEDILEEIVGEFSTLPPAAGAYRKQPDGTWLVDGSSLLRDLNRKLGLALPLDGPKTLNGLILEYLEDIPEAGTSLKIADHPLEIMQTQDRVVKVVRIFPPAAKTQ